MGKTTGTRHGNGKGQGPGHGGPAQGRGYGGPARTEPRGDKAAPWAPDMSGNPSGLPTERAAIRAERADRAEDFWAGVMLADEQPMQNRLKASENLHRAGRPELYRNVPEREAAEIEWYIEGAAEAISVDDWVQQTKLARAKPAGTAD